MPLPPLLVLTDRAATGGRPLLDVLRAALDGGARAVVVREKDLPARERAVVVAEVELLLTAVRGWTIVASGPGRSVHLAAGEPFPAGAELVGRSCHSADELTSARAEGCTYATLSPVFPTASKPGYGPPLGPGALRSSPLPVYALGGIASPEHAAACRAAGAAGVAVMGAVMGAADPAQLVADLLVALDERSPAGGPA